MYLRSLGSPLSLVFILGLPSIAQCFVPTPAGPRAGETVYSPRLLFQQAQQQQKQHGWKRYGVTAKAADGGEWDVESVRKQLENLVGGDCNGDDPSMADTSTFQFAVADKMLLPKSLTGNILPHSNSQLTVIARMRRETEIDLLAQLKENLNTVDDLYEFWMNERGSKAARDLQKADEVFQQGEASWNNAEHMFNQLIQEHGPTWAEPMHRLAMLYYLQGRLAEARTLEEYVLQIKPWHIGSLSNYVRIAESQRDVETALKWAAYRLPPRVGRRRAEWVERSVKAARQSLVNDEHRLSTFLGKSTMNRQVDSAWQ